MTYLIDGDICKLNQKDCNKPRTVLGDDIKARDGTPCLKKLFPDCSNCEVYLSKVLQDRLKDIKE